jgi:hypothetical protein
MKQMTDPGLPHAGQDDQVTSHSRRIAAVVVVVAGLIAVAMRPMPLAAVGACLVLGGGAGLLAAVPNRFVRVAALIGLVIGFDLLDGWIQQRGYDVPWWQPILPVLAFMILTFHLSSWLGRLLRRNGQVAK